jgi:hypothetical protein
MGTRRERTGSSLSHMIKDQFLPLPSPRRTGDRYYPNLGYWCAKEGVVQRSEVQDQANGTTNVKDRLRLECILCRCMYLTVSNAFCLRGLSTFPTTREAVVMGTG